LSQVTTSSCATKNAVGGTQSALGRPLLPSLPESTTYPEFLQYDLYHEGSYDTLISGRIGFKHPVVCAMLLEGTERFSRWIYNRLIRIGFNAAKEIRVVPQVAQS
jgi:hypothetical protein